MRVLRQRIGAAHHEQRAIKHVFKVEDPGRRGVQDVAFENFDTNDRHQHDEEPGKYFPNPGAEPIDLMKDALNVHCCGSPLGTTKHHPVFCGMVPCPFSSPSDWLLRVRTKVV